MVERTCQQCGKMFYTYPCEVKNGKGNFCSFVCGRKSLSQRFAGSGHPQYKQGILRSGKCANCGSTIEFSSDQRNKNYKNLFCNKECQNAWRKTNTPKGENAYHYKGGPIEKTCLFCGKQFFVEKNKIINDRGRFCSRDCYVSFYSGSRCHFWVHGNAMAPYPAEWRRSLRKEIRQRDNFTCQICGKTQDELGRRLSVHHIDYDKNNLDCDNLISLCASCHTKTSVNRDYWIRYFKGESLSAERG